MILYIFISCKIKYHIKYKKGVKGQTSVSDMRSVVGWSSLKTFPIRVKIGALSGTRCWWRAVEYNADEDGGNADDNDENYGADDENVDNGEDVIGDNVDDSVTSRGTQSYDDDDDDEDDDDDDENDDDVVVDNNDTAENVDDPVTSRGTQSY